MVALTATYFSLVFFVLWLWIAGGERRDTEGQPALALLATISHGLVLALQVASLFY